VFFIDIASRSVHVAGITPHPDNSWMTQIARNITDADDGYDRPAIDCTLGIRIDIDLVFFHRLASKDISYKSQLVGGRAERPLSGALCRVPVSGALRGHGRHRALKWSVAEAIAIFERVGLARPFWRLESRVQAWFPCGF